MAMGLAWCSGSAEPEAPSELARIGETPITVEDFLDAARLRGGPGTVPDSSSGDFEPYRKALFRSLTINALLLEVARIRGLHVEEPRIDAMVEEARKAFPGDYDAFVSELFGSVEHYRELIRRRAILEHCEATVRTELSDGWAPTDEQISAWFLAHEEEFSSPERFHLRQLAVPEKAQAALLRKRWVKGEDLDLLVSEALSAGGEGGDMGWFEAEALPEWLEDLRSIRGGRLSKILEGGGLFRVVQVQEVRKAESAKLKKAHNYIEHQLQMDRADEAFTQWIDTQLQEVGMKSDAELLASIACCKNGLPYVKETGP